MGSSVAHDRMVAMAAAEVTLRDRRTSSTWTVGVGPYELGAVPVTQARYTEIVGQSQGTAHGGGLPVVDVSWLDAVDFCNALSRRAGLTPAYSVLRDSDCATWDSTADGYRLPTEAEWEHACRAGTTGARYGDLDEIAWHRGNSAGRVHDVGGRRSNAWGLHDMLGNVWEWCWDLYDTEVYGSYRVLRGGGWSDPHWSCRASVRRRSHPTFRIDDVGFRVARGATA